MRNRSVPSIPRPDIARCQKDGNRPRSVSTFSLPLLQLHIQAASELTRQAEGQAGLSNQSGGEAWKVRHRIVIG